MEQRIRAWIKEHETIARIAAAGAITIGIVAVGIAVSDVDIADREREAIERARRSDAFKEALEVALDKEGADHG